MGAIVRIHGLSLWNFHFDEMWHLYVAKQPDLASVFHKNLTDDGHPILPYFIWHYILKFSEEPIILRIPSLFFGIISIPAAYFLGKEVFLSKNGGIFAAMFIAFSSMTVEQSQVIRGYGIMLFFVLVASYYSVKYMRSGSVKYLVLYFVFILISLLNEFVPVTVITIFGIFHFFKIIKAEKKLPVFVTYCLGNILILAYLLWFTYLLKTVGGSSFSNSAIFPYLYNDSLMMAFCRYLLFFIEFFISVNLFPLLSTEAPFSGVLFQLQILSSVVLPFVGFIYLKNNKELRPIFYFTALFFVLVIVLELFAVVPINFLRRQECFIFCVLILNYYSYVYIFKRIIEKLKSYVPLMLVFISVLITSVFVFNSYEIRRQKTHEFNFTEESKKQVFEFLENNVAEDDIIITDWLSYLFFYDKYKGSDAEKYSDSLKVYKNFKVPLYYFDYDYRNLTVYFSNLDIQKAVKEVVARNGDKKPNRIWIIEFQHAFFSSDLDRVTSDLSSERSKAEFVNELNTIREQHDSLRKFVHSQSDKSLIFYNSENCAKKYETNAERVGECIVLSSILGVNGEKLTEYLNDAPIFLDPNVIYEEMKRSNSKK